MKCEPFFLSGVEEPKLPRKRRCPERFEAGAGKPYHPDSPLEHYRIIYFNVLDNAVTAIEARFNQPGYAIMELMEQILIKASNGEEYVSLVTSELIDLYHEDINFAQLLTQLSMLKGLVQKHVNNFTEFLTWFVNSSSRPLLTQVSVIIQLLMVLPATNAISERSFSTLRRVKTYLRSSMTQERLNALMTLHIYKEKTTALDPKNIIKSYIGNSSKLANTIQC